jgi:hypothetical protein
MYAVVILNNHNVGIFLFLLSFEVICSDILLYTYAYIHRLKTIKISKFKFPTVTCITKNFG